MMAIQRRYPARYWELRIPKLPWPIEFLLPMTRLAFPTANLVDALGVGDTVRVTKIVESGVINIYLVGARGLRSMPQVEMTPGCGMDEKGGGGGGGGGGAGVGSVIGGNAAMGTPVGGNEVQGTQVGVSSSNAMATSPETRAASLVALHWAAKSLTVQPSPQVEFSYGNEKKSSNVSFYQFCILAQLISPSFSCSDSKVVTNLKLFPNLSAALNVYAGHSIF